MQLAFARVKESWEEAYLTNLATPPLEQVVEQIRTAAKVGLFTTDATPPTPWPRLCSTARSTISRPTSARTSARPTSGSRTASLTEIAAQEFSPLNVMILVRKPDMPDRPPSHVGRRLFGNPDEAFLQSKPKHGLLTPAEVRSIALAEMDLGPTSTVWDVGAGSGSVAIEAAQIATRRYASMPSKWTPKTIP